MRHVTLKNPEMSEDEKKQALEQRAKQRFGTTEDSKKAGYILSDGAMLDFTRQGAPRRNIDHSAVYDLYRDDQNNPDIPMRPHEESSTVFLKDTGAIRMHASPYGHMLDLEINTEKPPTPRQWDTIRHEFKQIQDRGEHHLAYDVYNPKGSRVDAKYIENASLGDLDALKQKVQTLA
jgi:hypothetical protein